MSSYLVCSLQGCWEIHESLDLDSVTWSHVSDVIEVGWSADQLGPTIRVPENRQSLDLSEFSDDNMGVWDMLVCLKTYR